LAPEIEYKASVRKDLKNIDKSEAHRILNKIEKELRLDANAGEPLKGPYKGLWKLRIGEYRVVYTKTEKSVIILRIRHRGKVYKL